MSYQIETIPPFDKAVKRLTRKYRHIKQDLQALVGTLSANPFAGVAIPGFAHQVWKIRLASSDIRAGKRGGYRVIYAISREARTWALPKSSRELSSMGALRQALGTTSQGRSAQDRAQDRQGGRGAEVLRVAPITSTRLSTSMREMQKKISENWCNSWQRGGYL